ncbi:MAG: AzlC family ABC transporter permease, partial [Chloroflexota bacterium]
MKALSRLTSRSRSPLMQGMTAALPICLGYIPVGIAFGVLAQKAGLSPLEIGLMSILVYAGSSQFIAVSMLSSGATAPSIIAT